MECKIQSSISYGPYDWCGKYPESGFYLTSKKKKQGEEKSKNSTMLYLKFEMNESLASVTDQIIVLDSNGCMSQYSMDLDGNTYVMFFPLVDSPRDYKIQFVKNLPRPEDYWFRRIPQEIVYEVKLNLPQLVTKGDNENCSICLDEFKGDDDDFISSCLHRFHFTCLWKYLTMMNYLSPLSSECARPLPYGCSHSEKAKPFPCPICKTIIVCSR